MEFTIALYVSIGLILLAGSTLQGIVGFASGLFSIPLMLLAGVLLPDAIAINLVATSVQSVLGAWNLSASLPWKTTIRPIAIRFVTLPIGVSLLWLASDWDQALIKQIIGSLVLVAVIAQGLWRVEPREELHQGWEWLAFSLSGTIAGFCGMGGPPMVLWVLAHAWDSARTRAFLFYMFVGGTPPQAAMMLFLFGSDLLLTFGFALTLTPFTAAGAFLGIQIGNTLRRERLRVLMMVVLVLIAVSAIASPYLG